MNVIKLRGNLVALSPIPEKVKPTSGIEIPDAYQPRPQIWRVIEVGPGRLRKPKGRPQFLDPIELKRGDRVLTKSIPVTRDAFSDGVVILDAQEILAKVADG